MSGANLPCILRATAPFVYVRLHGPDIDVGVTVVPEHPEASVQVQIDGRGLEVLGIVRIDTNGAGLERGPDVAVGQDAHAGTPVVPRSAYSESTSRLRSSRSSKLWYTLANRM